MYFVYVLKSLKDNKYYIGSTSNLDKRLVRHNKGWSRYTKNKGPFEVAYKEEYITLSETKKREHYVKSLKSKRVIEKLINGAVV